jgi:flagellar protein FliS
MYHKNLKAYKSNNAEAEMSVADPHRVIQMMMQGLLERLAQAKGAIDRRDYEAKSNLISKSMAIINGLQDSLDLSQGQIAVDLAALYIYMNERLVDASRNMDKTCIDEVANLLITIKSGWDQISDEDKQIAYEKKSQKGITA